MQVKRRYTIGGGDKVNKLQADMGQVIQEVKKDTVQGGEG